MARIGVSLENGAVTLAGYVSGYPQNVAVVRAAERVFGVRAVADELVVEPPDEGLRDDVAIAEAIAKELRWFVLTPRRKPTASELREQVTEAPERVAALDASQIWVAAQGDTVTLGGRVHSLYKKQLAERIAGSAPGFSKVVDEIIVKL